MLKEILNGYSAGELAEIIGKEVITEYEKLVGKELVTTDLADTVHTLYGFELVSQEKQREKLIDRMTQEQVDKVIQLFVEECLGNIPLDIKVNSFDALINLSNKWPAIFVSIMGYKDSLETSAEVDSGIYGIKTLGCTYPMYPYQQDMVKKVNVLLNSSENSRCLIHLPTGAGKTRTAMNIASEHLRSYNSGLVLWLADTSELCTQAASEFSKAWQSLGNRPIKQYSYYSDTNISLGGIDSGFLVAGLQKLNSARGSNTYKILYEQLKKFVTLIIFDEAHKSIAATYSRTVNDMINTNRKTFFLGLTATPGRKLDHSSDEDQRLSSFFHNNKVTMKVVGYESPIKYLIEKQYLARAKFVNIDYDGNTILLADQFSNQKRSDEIKKVLSEDENRNIKLLEVIKKEYEEGSSIIVFACNVEHSRKLASMLAFNRIKAHSLDSRYDNNQSRRYKVADYSKGNVRVLINYNILTTGFDAPITNVAVIARPTDSLVQYSQMAGRAMRGKNSGGNSDCTIYTVRDDIPAFRSVTHAFMHWDSLWNEV